MIYSSTAITSQQSLLDYISSLTLEIDYLYLTCSFYDLMTIHKQGCRKQVAGGGAHSANFEVKVHKRQSWYAYWSLAEAWVKKEDQEENKSNYLGYD